MRTCKKSWSEDCKEKIKQRRLITYWRTVKKIRNNNESEFKFDWKKKTKLKNDFTIFRTDCRAFRTDCEIKCYNIRSCYCDFRKDRLRTIFKNNDSFALWNW